jgi:hypothetical protein
LQQIDAHWPAGQLGGLRAEAPRKLQAKGGAIEGDRTARSATSMLISRSIAKV